MEEVLKVAAKPESLVEILDFVGKILDAHGCTPQARTQLRMAIEEVYVNIAHYAYSSEEGWAEISGSVEDDVATFCITDGGDPFDPLAKSDPDILLSGEERGIGGLGIFMVKSMVDDIKYEYSNGCNKLTLTKNLGTTD